jgi:peptidoglycan hydrolase CwlO-like protein
VKPFRIILAAVAMGAAALVAPIGSSGDPRRELASRSEAASALREAIAAETRRIEATGVGVRQAQARLDELQARVAERQAQLASVQRRIVAARERLTRLENRMQDAARALSAHLIAVYKDERPDFLTVVVNARGFDDLLERVEFLERIRRQDERILRNSRATRLDVLAETTRLGRLEKRNRDLTAEVMRERNRAAAVQGALLTRQADQLRARANTSARLRRVRGEMVSLRREISRLSRPATPTANAELPVAPGGMAQVPAGAPAAVKRVVAAGNAIAGLPYAYGGGHGSFRADAYDCSGSISYALAAAGLLSAPLNSSGFMSWGESGPGRWITIYTNPGHAFMVVGGWRFDTSALSGGGTRWTRSMRDTSGFAARHPAGL